MAKKETWEEKYESYKKMQENGETWENMTQNNINTLNANRKRLAQIKDTTSVEYRNISAENNGLQKRLLDVDKEKFNRIIRNLPKVEKAKENRDAYQELLDELLQKKAAKEADDKRRSELQAEVEKLDKELKELSEMEGYCRNAINNPEATEENKANARRKLVEITSKKNQNQLDFAGKQEELRKHDTKPEIIIPEDNEDELKDEIDKWNKACELLLEGKDSKEVLSSIKRTKSARENSAKGKTTEEKPGEEKPGEEKPGEEKPGEEKPGEEKPGEEKPGEEKPEGEQPEETKPEETKPEGEQPEGAKPEGENPEEEQAEEEKPEEELENLQDLFQRLQEESSHGGDEQSTLPKGRIQSIDVKGNNYIFKVKYGDNIVTLDPIQKKSLRDRITAIRTLRKEYGITFLKSFRINPTIFNTIIDRENNISREDLINYLKYPKMNDDESAERRGYSIIKEKRPNRFLNWIGNKLLPEGKEVTISKAEQKTTNTAHMVERVNVDERKAQEEAKRREDVRQIVYGIDGNGDNIVHPEDGEEK